MIMLVLTPYGWAFFLNILKEPEDEEDIKKEKVLSKFLIGLLGQKDCSVGASKSDVDEGYKLLVDLVKIGGSFK